MRILNLTIPGVGPLWRSVGRRTRLPLSLLAMGIAGFELFNFVTSAYALNALLEGLSTWGLPWPTMLALAACLCDFAGLWSLSHNGRTDLGRSNLLAGAWALSAMLNAFLTWLALSLVAAGLDKSSPVWSITVLSRPLPEITAVFIAVFVLLIRVLLVGAASSSIRELSAVEPDVEACDPIGGLEDAK